MKFYGSGLANLIKLITKGDVNALLIHGANVGFGATAIEQISKKLSLLVSSYSAKEITPSKLNIIANNRNFFGQRELIKITGTSSAFNKEMKELFLDNQFYHFICFVANDSLPPSGIRKFFEDQGSLACLACYYDNEQTVAKMILQQASKRGKTLEEDALYYLKSHLKGDHQIIKSELEKLFNYTYDKFTITKQDVMDVLSADLLASGDEMCAYFAKNEPDRFLKEVQKLKDQNKNEVLMIRALIRYYMNIYAVSLRVEDGENIDRAIKTLYPPIFFKYVDEFKQVLRRLNASDALHCIAVLQNSEIEFKTNPKSFDLFSVYVECNVKDSL